jgi:hypothetical protein
MNGREDYIRRQNEVQRPSINFTRRDDVRDLMKSPAGQNYGNMMDLQSQAIRSGGFDKGDPRVAELKAARRKYNRQDKYNIGNLMGYEPLDVQDIYRQNSGVLRDYARPTYKEMYPISDIAHQFVGSGGLTGMLLQKALGDGKKLGKNFFDDLRTMGSDIIGNIGIGGGLDTNEEELKNYANLTYPSDVHPELQREEEGQLDFPELPQEDLDVMAQYPVVDYQAPIGKVSSMRSIGDRGTVPYGYEMNALDAIAEDDYKQGIDVRAFPPPNIPDREVAPPEIVEPLPFNDSGREAGIAALYGQGPRFGTTNRRYENEYRDFLASQSDTMRQFEPVTYEEFAEAYERMYQGKPQIGFR